MPVHPLGQHRNGLARSLPWIQRHFTHITTRRSFWSSELIERLKSRRLPILYDDIGTNPDALLNNTLEDFLPPLYSPRFLRKDRRGIIRPGHHLVYFPPPARLSSLLPDGTDPQHSPGEPFVRRMWAGGCINVKSNVFATLQKIPRAAACVERIVDVKIKGRIGDEKVFVTIDRRVSRTNWKAPHPNFEAIKSGNHDAVRRILSHNPNCAVIEQRTLVFMRERSRDVAADAAKEPGKVIKAPHEATFSHVLTPTPALLFRFSALTFNAHRIHLDKQYCREVEGHRNLLVHGPLSVILMLELLRRHLMPKGENWRGTDDSMMVDRIEYRNLAPLYAEEPMKICGRPLEDGKWELWIEGRDGGLAVRATARTILLWKPSIGKDSKETKDQVEEGEKGGDGEEGEDGGEGEDAEDVEHMEQADGIEQQEQAEEEKPEKQE